jgi:hypothetical protein
MMWELPTWATIACWMASHHCLHLPKLPVIGSLASRSSVGVSVNSSEQWAVSSEQWAVSVNSVNIVHSVNKVVNPHKDNYQYVGGVNPHKDYNHYVGGGPPHIGDLDVIRRRQRWELPTWATDICRLLLMWEAPTMSLRNVSVILRKTLRFLSLFSNSKRNVYISTIVRKLPTPKFNKNPFRILELFIVDRWTNRLVWQS